jgi:hypothetical protein
MTRTGLGVAVLLAAAGTAAVWVHGRAASAPTAILRIGRVRRVEIRWTAPAETGLVRHKLVFNTGRESLPQIELPIYARVQ